MKKSILLLAFTGLMFTANFISLPVFAKSSTMIYGGKEDKDKDKKKKKEEAKPECTEHKSAASCTDKSKDAAPACAGKKAGCCKKAGETPKVEEKK